MCVAADEIERLRAELQQSRLNHLTTLSELQDAAEQSHRLRAERDAERALADQLAEALCQMVTWSCCPDGNFGPCGCGPDVPRLPEGEENAEAIAAYEEARREQ
jgi:hypothetical protein